MNNKEKIKLPKDFFTQTRPEVNTKALDDIIPIEWSEEVTSRKKKAIVYSAKEKNIL